MHIFEQITQNANFAQNTSTEDDWWADAEELDSFGPVSELHNLLDFPASTDNIFSIEFLPPPPRPSDLLALEELGSEAFTSTCDLCSWAWSNPAFAIDPNRKFQFSNQLKTIHQIRKSFALFLWQPCLVLI
jgi:hypothetical protein